jgi:hypothetical protein
MGKCNKGGKAPAKATTEFFQMGKVLKKITVKKDRKLQQ